MILALGRQDSSDENIGFRERVRVFPDEVVDDVEVDCMCLLLTTYVSAWGSTILNS